ncbi:MAG TPA: bifunctional 4-hydroxy-2-oxoglutarate aldolase/2-dehydro-3-deoxy-phosphogluconate aldolase [Candidatus Limnocylindrales bacterium]|nr:bifunctional 4-hydroxy-2-oxoglutarate aldolase/2-dehydro-3-deoxy-phosphogluconate aldolase [Candidatus Limnocylindrales bacterium]
MLDRPAASRATPVAAAIREHRLVVILRRVAPRDRLLALAGELVQAGACVFEVTLDAPGAAEDLAALREHVLHLRSAGTWVGAGTVRSTADVRRAVDAGAAFAVSPVLDRAVMDAAAEHDLPFIPGAYTPTEIDAAWRAGATFVKLFPGSSAGPPHVREVRAPLPEIEIIVTGGVDASNASAFLAAGATAVGLGSALLRATPEERRALVESIRSQPRGSAAARRA